MLQAENIRFSYKRNREVLKGISFELGEGGILCLLGSNGTGKTTLLRCLLGFQRASEGSILADGQDVLAMTNRQRAHHMAYVPQSSALAFPYKAREVVLMGRVSHLAGGAAHSARDKRVVQESMERLQIEHLAERHYQELSGGEKQMVLVARALAQESKTLIMDEPTANLDYHNQIKILRAIRHLSKQGLSILMTSHYPDHAFLACTQVALMKGGLIVASGKPDDVVSTQSLTNLYDTPVHVTYANAGAFKIKTCIPLLDETLADQPIEG